MADTELAAPRSADNDLWRAAVMSDMHRFMRRFATRGN